MIVGDGCGGVGGGVGGAVPCWWCGGAGNWWLVVVVVRMMVEEAMAVGVRVLVVVVLRVTGPAGTLAATG